MSHGRTLVIIYTHKSALEEFNLILYVILIPVVQPETIR